MIQLLITFGLIAIFHFTYVYLIIKIFNKILFFLFRPSIREYIKTGNGQWLYFTSYAVFLVTYLALACSKRAARRFPLNMVLLLLLVKKTKTI